MHLGSTLVAGFDDGVSGGICIVGVEKGVFVRAVLENLDIPSLE